MSNRLLIIDDEIQFGRFVGQVGDTLGYSVKVTARAQDFKENFLQWQPEVVILDLSMPSMDGLELLRWLAAKNCRANIIIVSGFDARVIDAAKRVGEERGLSICFTLSKPVRVQEIREKLQSLKQKGVAPFQSPPAPKEVLAAEWQTQEAKASFTRAELARGLEAEEFFLLYQPKVFLKTGALEGVEALVRWQHPQQGMLTPHFFISEIEEMGLMDELTDKVLSMAVRQQKIWREQGLNLQVAVNLSPTNLRNGRFADNLVALCSAENVPPASLALEITETTAMNYRLEELDILTRLRLQGFALSIDDFGTGYSSLTRLQRLPITELKIDISFIRNMLKDMDAQVIVQTVIDLAHNMRLHSVAEGVETPELYLRVADLGCDVGQGYAIAHPLPAADIRQWSLSWNPPAAGTKAVGERRGDAG